VRPGHYPQQLIRGVVDECADDLLRTGRSGLVESDAVEFHVDAARFQQVQQLGEALLIRAVVGQLGSIAVDNAVGECPDAIDLNLDPVTMAQWFSATR
jgi:hypothetical protein